MKKLFAVLLVCLLSMQYSVMAETEEIFYEEKFDVATGDELEITDANIATLLGAGWSVYKTDNGTIGEIAASTSYGKDDYSVTIDADSSIIGTGKVLGIQKTFDEPLEGKVTIANTNYFVDSSTPSSIKGGYQTMIILDGNGDEIIRVIRGNNKQFYYDLPNDNKGQKQILQGKSAAGYLDFRVTVDTEEETAEVALYLYDYTNTFNDLSGVNMTKEARMIQGEIVETTKLTIKTPLDVDASAGVGAVVLGTICSNADYNYTAIIDNLVVTNVSVETEATVISDRGQEIGGDIPVSVLTDTMDVTFDGDVNVDYAEVLLEDADGNIVDCDIIPTEDGFCIDHATLEKNIHYYLTISSVYDVLGAEYVDTIHFFTDGLPVAADGVSIKNQTATGVGYDVSIRNDYDSSEPKTAVIMLVQYGSDGKIKEISTKPIALTANDVTEDEISITYKNPVAGDRVEILIWNSLDFESGVHPLLSLDEEYGFTI